MQSNNECIKKLSEIDIENDVRMGSTGAVEANVRAKIVSKLFICLGWDEISDLSYEHTILRNKHADIAVLVPDPFGTKKPKIIVECKDLNENLDNHIDQAFDYAIPLGVRWIVLSNGIEFRLYETFLEGIDVAYRKGLLLISPPILLTELEERFDELIEWISKDKISFLEQKTEIREVEIRKNVNARILNQVFVIFLPKLKDFYQDNIKSITRSAEELEEGLREEPREEETHSGEEKFAIELKRRIFAWLEFKGINYRDIDLWSEIYAKEAALTLINRILFRRICEDSRNPKVAEKLSKKGIDACHIFHKDWTYKNLLDDAIQEIRKIDYESIYNLNIFDCIIIEENLLKELILQFSKINFSVIDSEILKNVYQEHINEEERKNLGQYYTPDYIINFILHSIDIISDLTLEMSSDCIKILDPACGSGSFLTEAYEILKKKMIEYWDNNIIHEIILTKFLYGIDIEPFAAQFSTINLLIKDVSNPVNYVFITHHDTLETGGALMGKIAPVKIPKLITRETSISDDYDEKEFPLADYDVVVGNPPYFLITSREGSRPTGKKFHTTYLKKNRIQSYKETYNSWPHDNKNTNIFYLFLERGIEFLKDGGYLGFIIPDILLSGISTTNLRTLILKNCKIKKIFLIEGEVFEGVGMTNIIIILQKSNDKNSRRQNKVQIINTSEIELRENNKVQNYNTFMDEVYSVPQRIFIQNPYNIFSVRMNEQTWIVFLNINRKLKENTLIKLEELANIQRGIEYLAKKDALDRIPSTKTTYRKLIAVDNVEKYKINWDATSFPRKYVDYDVSGYPRSRKVKLKKESWFTQEKIVLKRISNKLIAALDEKKTRPQDYFFTLDSIQMIWLKNVTRYDIRVLLAILNSDFMNFYYTMLFSYKKLFSKVQKAFLNELPIPPEIDDDINNEIVSHVKNLEQGYDEDIEKELNDIILSLYFTEEEIEDYRALISLSYSLQDLPGLGYKIQYELNKLGIKTLGELADCDVEEVANRIKGVGRVSLENWIEFIRDLEE